MTTFSVRTFIAAIALLTISQQVQAGTGYSVNCDDYQSVGFTSRDLCLRDGRWHVVYENDNRGFAKYGSVDILQNHIASGADVKIVAPAQTLSLNGYSLPVVFNANEKCQQAYRSQSGVRPIYCLSPVRFSGENANETSQGSARYGTDGRVYCNGINNPGSNGCNADPIALKWFVKY